MTLTKKLNGKYISDIECHERLDYNDDWTRQVMFLRRIIMGLDRQLSKDETKLLKKQLNDRIIDVVNKVKSEAAPHWLKDDYKFDKKDIDD